MYNLLPDNIDIEETSKQNISNIALAKVRKAKQKKLIKSVTSVAASFAIVFCVMWAIGFENVVSAAERIFYFIPGFGIQEQAEDEPLVLKRIVSRGNPKVDITLVNARTGVYAETMPCIYFNFLAEYKDFLPDYEYNGYKFELEISGKSYDVSSGVGATGVDQDEKYYIINGVRIYTGDAIIKNGQKCVLKITSETFGTVRIPFRLVTAEDVSNYEIQSNTLGEIDITAVKYKVKLQGKKYVVVDVLAESSEAAISFMDTVFKKGEESIFPEKLIGNSYYFDADRVEAADYLEVSNIDCYYTFNEKKIELPIIEHGEKESVDFSYPIPNGIFKITGVSRSGNMYTIHSEVESEYDVWTVSPSYETYYESYSNHTEDDGTQSIVFKDSFFERDSATIKVDSVWYVLGTPVKFTFN